MSIYDNGTDLTTPNYEHDLDAYPILKCHWPDGDLIDFAQGLAATELRGSWVHPDDRGFRDRPPPGAPAAARPKPPQALDIVAALRAERRAA